MRMPVDARHRCFGSVVAVVAILLPAGAALAVPMSVYQGTLGGSDVVLEVGAADASGVRAGRYFYRRLGVDIPLNGHGKELAEALPLDPLGDRAEEGEPVFNDPDTGKPRVVWQGELNDKRYAGFWRELRTKKTLPFELKHVATYDPEALRPGAVEAVTLAIVQGASSGVSSSADISMASAPYDHLRLNVPQKQGKEVARGAVAYRMVKDPRTRIAYPRLTRHPDTAMQALTNRLLERRHWALNLEALSCASTRYTSRGPAAGSLGGFDDESVVVDYLSPSLMSVVESGSTYCGGAHPNNHFEPYTLDLVRGGYFDFSQIFKGYLRGEYVPEYSPSFMAFVQRQTGRQARRDKTVVGRAKTDLDGCEDIWPEYLYLHFQSPDRLAFDISGIGHAMGVCLGTHLTVPFALLRPLLKPGASRYLSAAP